MADAMWKLVPKLKPEHAEDHARFVGELAAARAELKSIGFLAKLVSPKKDKRHRELKAQIATLEKQIKACVAPVGRDLEPPRIGMDDRATKWYRKHLSKDPEAWPLPPDEMIEELHGAPVWELSKYEMLHHLDVGWPDGGFPLPKTAGLSFELLRSLACTLDAKGAEAAAERLEEATLLHLRASIPGMDKATPQVVVGAVVRGRAPNRPAGDPTEQTLLEARSALSAVSWLRFWGSHGYGFTYHGPGGG